MKNMLFDELCNENITVNFEGDEHVFTEGVAFTTSSETFLCGERKFQKSINGDSAQIIITNEDTGVEVNQHYEFFGDVIRQKNLITNLHGDEKVLINASSAMFSFPYAGILPWNDDRRFKLHICKCAWSAEVQWHCGSLVDFGLNPVCTLGVGMQGLGRIVISSKGSWSNGAMIIISILPGGKKAEKINSIYVSGVRICAELSILLSTACYLLAPYLIGFMQVKYGVIYFKIRAVFLILQALATFFTSVLRAYGSSKQTMIYGIITNAVNALISILVVKNVFFAGNKTAGVAFAAVTGQFAGLVYTYVSLRLSKYIADGGKF